jgi:hypothetical protein
MFKSLLGNYGQFGMRKVFGVRNLGPNPFIWKASQNWHIGGKNFNWFCSKDQNDVPDDHGYQKYSE